MAPNTKNNINSATYFNFAMNDSSSQASTANENNQFQMFNFF